MLRSWITTIVLAGCCLQAALAAEQSERIGRAYDASSGVLLYEERHLETRVNGALLSDQIHYLDPQGRTFGNKRVDFGQHPYLPEFSLDNERTGHMEELTRVASGEVEVRFRERSEQRLQQARLPAPDDAVNDSGFAAFIDSNWDALLSGESLVRRFLVPSRLEFMNFRVRRADGGDGADPGTVLFTVEIDSIFLRLVAPPINVLYARDTRRLLRYEGLSNLRDDRGDNLSVRIEYETLTRSAQVAE